MMKKIISILVIIVLLPILFINGIIVVNSFVNPDKIPSFFGWKPFIVLSGSMESNIMPGDIVVVKETDTSDLKENDIIAFKSGDIVITHRIVEIVKENGKLRFVTQGDNNNTKDSDFVLPENVEGIYKFKIGKLGNLAMFIQTPIGMVVSLSIPLFLFILVHLKEANDEKKELEEKVNKQKEMQKEIEELKKKNNELQKTK